HDRAHRAAGHLGVAMRDRDGVLFMQAQEHLRVAVAEQIDEAVMEPAIGGAGVERDIGQVELAQHQRDGVAAPIVARLVGQHRPLEATRPRCVVAHPALLPNCPCPADTGDRITTPRTTEARLCRRAEGEAAMDLWRLDATDLARLIRLGQASSREAVTACLARMDRVNAKVNAVVRRMDGEALAAADAADATRARGVVLGPLHGVPITVKVNTDQRGHPTDNGVVAFKDLMAPDDAPVVSNLRAAGAIIIGRTNVPAFSMRAFSENDLHGRTLNPRDRDITPGGSSGGAASA